MIAIPIEASLIRLTGGLGWLIGSLWAWATARPELERTDRVIAATEKGVGSGTNATRNREFTQHEANRRRTKLWICVAGWLVSTICGVLWWQWHTGQPWFIQAGLHTVSIGVLLWLIQLEITSKEVDVALGFLMLLSNTGAVAWFQPGPTAVGLAVPFIAGFIVAWVHGPGITEEEPEEALAAIPAHTGRDARPTAIVQGLRNGNPAVDAAFKEDEKLAAAAAKLGSVHRPANIIPPFDLETDPTTGRKSARISLPNKALVRNTDPIQVATAVGKHPLAVFLDPIAGIESELEISILPQPMQVMDPGFDTNPVNTPGSAFDGVAHGRDHRWEPVTWAVHNVSSVWGGSPKQGKSNGLSGWVGRILTDPTAKVALFNFAGNIDFDAYRAVAETVVETGELDTTVDSAVEQLVVFMRWLYHEEHARRGKRLAELGARDIRKAHAVADPSLGAYLLVIDEVHVATEHDKWGDEITNLLSKLSRESRKMAITTHVATQDLTGASVDRFASKFSANRVCFYVPSSYESGPVLGDNRGDHAPKPETLRPINGVSPAGLAAVKGEIVGPDGNAAQWVKFPLVEVEDAAAFAAGLPRRERLYGAGVPVTAVPDTAGASLLAVWDPAVPTATGEEIRHVLAAVDPRWGNRGEPWATNQMSRKLGIKSRKETTHVPGRSRLNVYHRDELVEQVGVDAYNPDIDLDIQILGPDHAQTPSELGSTPEPDGNPLDHAGLEGRVSEVQAFSSPHAPGADTGFELVTAGNTGNVDIADIEGEGL